MLQYIYGQIPLPRNSRGDIFFITLFENMFWMSIFYFLHSPKIPSEFFNHFKDDFHDK